MLKTLILFFIKIKLSYFNSNINTKLIFKINIINYFYTLLTIVENIVFILKKQININLIQKKC